jgi:hypothetical protein
MSRRKDFKTSRRKVLRGLGGIAVGLPFLELFRPKLALAAPAPLRYVIGFGGSSLGMDGSCEVTTLPMQGPLGGMPLNIALQPLADEGVTDYASWISGMKIPWSANPTGSERAIGFHASSPCPLLSGTASSTNTEQIQGETSDWMVAKALGGPTLTTRPVLTYRVQPAYYRGSNSTTGTRGTMSVRDNNGQLEQNPPQINPQVAFQDLFTGFIPPDPAEAAAAQFLLARRRSVIDLVKGDAERLIPRLGARDKQRMERHFDELRRLENRLNALNPGGGAECAMLPDPGSFPIGTAVDDNNYNNTNAYSDEEARATVMADLIHMAFVCDLSRVGAWMFTYSQCFMNLNPIFGITSDLHECSHFGAGNCQNGGPEAVATGLSWHVKHFARLAKMLDDSIDIDGNTILDNTAMVLVFEGGHGYDPEGDKTGSAHSTENMGALIMGKAGGLHASPGQHIVATDTHPATVITTALSALGLPAQLGAVSGTIPGLIG